MSEKESGPERGREEDDREAAELLSRCRAGDRDAFGLLVRRYEGPVFRFVLSRVGDGDRAADVTQDTFIKAFRGLDGFRGESAILTWLLAIARNELRAGFRTAVRRREQALETGPDPVDPAAGPDDEMIRRAEVDRVRDAILDLPEKQQMSVSLRLFDGLSFREVAEAVGTSEGSARVNFFHGIRKLREWLDDDIQDES